MKTNPTRPTEAASRPDLGAGKNDSGLLLLGLIAILVIQMFRASFHHFVPLIWMETIVLGSLPIGISFWMQQRITTQPGGWNKVRVRTVLQVLIIGQLGLILASQWLSRQYDIGDANEIIVLLMVQHAGWSLAIFCRWIDLRQTAFVILNSLVLFVCFIAENSATYTVAGLYWAASLWWLIGNYWSDVNEKSLDGECRMLPVKGVFFAAAVLLVLVIVGAGATRLPEPVLRGCLALFPFSGGERGTADRYARSGVGEGDRLTTGSDPTTVGALETDQFIEDHRPSIYDILMDRFDGPVTPQKQQERNRAIALSLIAKHAHDIRQMERSGKLFRTTRESQTSNARKQTESETSQALLLVEGPGPARFSLQYFHHFDGWDWSNDGMTSRRNKAPAIVLDQASEKPWFELRQPKQDYLWQTRSHRVTVMRLKSKSLPTPALPHAWHIQFATQASLFRWSDAGHLEFNGNALPEHTMIDLVSYLPDHDQLRNLSPTVPGAARSTLPTSGIAGDAPEQQDLLQVPDNQATQQLRILARKWTRDVQPGWSQVETMIRRLRTDYQLDDEARATVDDSDSVSQFLDRGRGPSYLFATTAVQLLRVAGYPARLANGFLVRSEDYDHRLGQAEVTAKHLHFWPEVCLDGVHWIPLEPTPGFPMPPGARTWWNVVKTSALIVLDWCYRNPVRLLTAILTIGLLIHFRVRILISAAWIQWWLNCQLLPGKCLAHTRRLIDFRFQVAGYPRPPHRTVGAWYTQIKAAEGLQFFEYWYGANYGATAAPLVGRQVTWAACRQLVQTLTYDRILESRRAEISTSTPSY